MVISRVGRLRETDPLENSVFALGYNHIAKSYAAVKIMRQLCAD